MLCIGFYAVLLNHWGDESERSPLPHPKLINISIPPPHHLTLKTLTTTLITTQRSPPTHHHLTITLTTASPPITQAPNIYANMNVFRNNLKQHSNAAPHSSRNSGVVYEGRTVYTKHHRRGRQALCFFYLYVKFSVIKIEVTPTQIFASVLKGKISGASTTKLYIHGVNNGTTNASTR